MSDLQAIAEKHGVSRGAAEAALDALRRGRGMAQFSHPELGGVGQWSPGMTMVGDMFNAGLKAKVDGLFHDLAGLVEREPAARGNAGRGAAWWPADLGEPASTGSQNDMRYAHFPDRQRLAVWQGGTVTLYDTGGRAISGFGQQQSGSGSISLSGPDGSIALDKLTLVKDGGPTDPPSPGASVEPRREETERAAPSGGDPIAQIERLADLHRKGVLTDAEFAEKKAQLLARVS